MNLTRLLQQRVAGGHPLRIGLIGAGKFGSMYLAQIPRTPGVHLVGIADLNPAGARANLARADDALRATDQMRASSTTPSKKPAATPAVVIALPIVACAVFAAFAGWPTTSVASTQPSR